MTNTMRFVLAGIFLAMMTGFGLVAYNWYQTRYGGEPFGAPFALVDHNGAPITEAALRGHPSAVFLGFTH